MRTPKIVIIGAGSASFGLTNLGAILRTKELTGASLRLCDSNAEGLEEIRKLAVRLNEEWGAGMQIETSTDRRRLLPDADFVVISVAVDRESCWKADYELGRKYGVLHYAENGGPGGFFHAARNLAILMPVLHDVEQLAPNALTLNFTNPMTRICTAAARYTKVNMAGICHQLDFGYKMVGRILGRELGLDIPHGYRFRWGNDEEGDIIWAEAHRRLDILAAGINHFTWFLSIKDKETGEELFPLFKKKFLQQTDFEPYTRALIEVFDECPTSGDAHLLEYLPYTSNMARGGWQKYDIQMYPLDDQEEKRQKMWKEITAMASGEKGISHLKDAGTERAEMIMASVWTGQNLCDYAVNIPNSDGCISNMERDAIVEVPVVLGHHGVRGIAAGCLPPIAAAFCNRQKTIVDLAVTGMAEGDYRASLQALALDPMIDDLDVARGILDDGLQLFEAYLPQFRS